jgi:LmbE family N-acetylglucosaminyl deacetylase
MKVLVISAHMDDEILGVGGTMLKHSFNGDEVSICYVTDSSSTQYEGDEEKLRAKYKQAEEVRVIVGAKNISFLDFPDMKLDTVSISKLAGAISKKVNEIDPDIVYMHSNKDLNRDHRICHEATLIACRPLSSNVKELYAYEVLSSTEWNSEHFKPTMFVDITGFLKEKQRAMSVYKDELREYPHPRSIEGLQKLAEVRGMTIGKTFAEAFEVIRKIK